MTLNPLNLTGEPFLLFYVLVFLAVNCVRWLLNKTNAVDENNTALRNDPYLLAFLARGPVHAINTATFSLIDRKLLWVSGTEIKPTRSDAAEFTRRPLEKAIISYLSQDKTKASQVSSDPQVRKAADLYLPKLEEMGLLPGSSAMINQKTTGLLLALAFGLLGVVKIYVGLSRGHHNVLFLLMLTIVVVYYFYTTSKKRITKAGESVLASTRTRYKPLKSKKNKKSTDSTVPEIAYQFALFGLAGLPATAYAWQKALIPPRQQRSDTSGSSCSSCGSGGTLAADTGGSSCSSGSSCSGGGGGGCGGCGG